MSSGSRIVMVLLFVLLVSQWSGCTNTDDPPILGTSGRGSPTSERTLWLGDGLWAEQVKGSDEYTVFEIRFRILGEDVTGSYAELLEMESRGLLEGTTRLEVTIFRSVGEAPEEILSRGIGGIRFKQQNEPNVIETCWTCVKLCAPDPDCMRECTKKRCG